LHSQRITLSPASSSMGYITCNWSVASSDTQQPCAISMYVIRTQHLPLYHCFLVLVILHYITVLKVA